MRLFSDCKSVIGVAMLLLAYSDACGQALRQGWISAPKDWGGWQVWMNRTYADGVKPRSAHVEVMTDGRYDLYVNQFGVGRDVLMPYRDEADCGLMAVGRHDITPYLQDSTNTIALWIAPQEGRKQCLASVCYYGIDAEGQPFAYYSDDSWLCHKANAHGDTIDAMAYLPYWNSDTLGVAMWRNASTVGYDVHSPIAKATLKAHRVVAVHQPVWQQASDDTLTAGFGSVYMGWARVTLRDAKRGERIRVNGLTYVCDGTMDEQACRKFTVEYMDRIVITGDSHFTPSQVVGVELVEISDKW